MQGTQVRALVWEDPTCRGATGPTTTEPVRLELVLCNKRGHDSERPMHRDEEWPPLAATRESSRTENEDPTQPKIKKERSFHLKQNKTSNYLWQFLLSTLTLNPPISLTIKMYRVRPSRWWTSKTWRSPSSPQIHQKHICMWNNSYRTATECWQKNSDIPKGKKLPTYMGRAKEKRKNKDKRIGTGPAPVGGSCEGGKVFTH